MSEHKDLYVCSLEEAVRMNEQDLWRESYKENCDCARTIEKAIEKAYDYEKYHLNDCAEPLIKEYGFNRVNWVLANTIQQKRDDGRFSDENKQWARQFYIPRDDVRWHFSVDSPNPGLVDLFINQVRKLWDELGLFDRTHCVSEKDGQIDYEGKVVVISPHIFKDEYKNPDDQLFYVTGGFGARPNSRGRKVFGHFLKDGEETHYYREDILGVLKDEHLPEWAQEKLTENNQLNEDEGISMGGM